MDSNIREIFDAAYKDNMGETEPHGLVVRVANELLANNLPINCSVLELGSGNGRNALHFAKLGFKVTAVDVSSEGIKRMNENAEKMGVRIEYINGGMEDPLILSKLGKFDAIVSINSLHFLPERDVNDVISWMKSATNPNGYNVISAFGEKEVVRNPKIQKYFFKKDELKQKYYDWLVKFYEEVWKAPKTEHAINCQHYYARLIAQKTF